MDSTVRTDTLRAGLKVLRDVQVTFEQALPSPEEDDAQLLRDLRDVRVLVDHLGDVLEWESAASGEQYLSGLLELHDALFVRDLPGHRLLQGRLVPPAVRALQTLANHIEGYPTGENLRSIRAESPSSEPQR